MALACCAELHCESTVVVLVEKFLLSHS